MTQQNLSTKNWPQKDWPQKDSSKKAQYWAFCCATIFLIPASLLLTSCAGTPDEATPESELSPPTQTPAAPPPLPEGMSPIPDTELPEAVKASVFQDIATSQNIPVESLQVVGARRESWPDGCLGLGGPDEICTNAIVEGWEVTVSRDNDIWVYRTDSDGVNIRSVDVPATESF